MIHKTSSSSNVDTSVKRAKLKSHIGVVCISLSLFLLFVPLNFGVKFNIILTIISFAIPFLTALLFIFVIPIKPFIFLVSFYLLTSIVWFAIMSNINMNAQAEWYFFLLFFPFMIFFIVGNFLYSKESDLFAYLLILLIAAFVYLEG